MTYFLFPITNKCNQACPYCIVKPYMNNPAYPDKITKEAVFNYFNIRAKKDDLIEITGGEPTLIDWLEEFIEFLNKKNVKVLLRTNGFKLFKNVYKNLVIVFNPHYNSKEYENDRKRLLCKTDFVYKPKITDKQIPDTSGLAIQNHPFDEMRFISADGNIRPMSCSEVSIGNIFEINDTNIQYDDIKCIYKIHAKCPFILGAWNLTG